MLPNIKDLKEKLQIKYKQKIKKVSHTQIRKIVNQKIAYQGQQINVEVYAKLACVHHKIQIKV